MGLFTIVWMGQVVSSFGSTLSSFALGVRVFQDTGSVTRFALIAMAMVLPNLVLSPLAGVIADRWDRRKVLILSHVGSALCTMALLRLVVTDRIVAWHVYPVVAASAVFATFVWPTFSAATTMMVGKAQLGRAAGMNEFGMALAQVVAPISAAGLLVAVGLRGVILIDFTTFAFAIVVLLAVRFPQPPKGAPVVAPGAGLKAQMLVGWSYIRARPALWGLLLLAAGHKFSVALVQTLLTPLVLGFASPAMLGLVLGAASGGMLVGGIAVSVWGGPQRRVPAILTVMVVQGLLLMLGGLRPSVTLIACTSFLFLLFLPIVIASNQAIWQSKVAPEIQGRVFATRRMVAGSMMPIALAFRRSGGGLGRADAGAGWRSGLDGRWRDRRRAGTWDGVFADADGRRAVVDGLAGRPIEPNSDRGDGPTRRRGCARFDRWAGKRAARVARCRR